MTWRLIKLVSLVVFRSLMELCCCFPLCFLDEMCNVLCHIVTHRPIARHRLGEHIPNNMRPTIQQRCFMWSVLCLLIRSVH
jgi:hypothetical protein